MSELKHVIDKLLRGCLVDILRILLGERWWWGRVWAGRGRWRRTRPLREQARRHTGPSQHARLMQGLVQAGLSLPFFLLWCLYFGRKYLMGMWSLSFWNLNGWFKAQCDVVWVLINGVFGGENVRDHLLVSCFFFFFRDWIDGTESPLVDWLLFSWLDWWYGIHVVLLGWW